MQNNLERIQELLESSNPDEIREGAYLSADCDLNEVVPMLVKRIVFPNPGVQEAVEGALRKIGGQAVLYAVLPFLRIEDSAVRNIAMDLLRDVGKCDVPALTELLRDDDPDLRIFGADILGATGSALAVTPLCHSLLRDPETNVRYQAAVSLGILGFPEAAESLGMALKDEEWVQFAVIEALTKIGDESSVAALLIALDKSTELVASSIVDALGKLAYIKAVPMLIRALPQASVPLANKIICAVVNIVGPRSLSMLGAHEYSKLKAHLLTALEDEDVEVQDAAINGLASGKGDEEFAVIFKILSSLNPDTDSERMLKIVNTLAAMGYHKKLAELAASDDEAVALLAVEIMSRLNDPAIVPLLESVFWQSPRDLQRAILLVLVAKSDAGEQSFFSQILDRHKDGSVLKSAMYYFGKLGNSELIFEKIFPFLDHPYNDVKEAALDACIKVHSPEINKKLQEMSKNGQELHRMMAFHALGRYGTAENRPYIVQGLRDASAEVRRVAVEALHSFVNIDLDAMNMLEQ
ncbi:MAG: HEAT repeat domain-containing protein, partial [Deltaproteobacteria bacterium]|nr:HEAT repeat domain-containing protein [Deltaproteobacteria bacterium]